MFEVISMICEISNKIEMLGYITDYIIENLDNAYNVSVCFY